MSRLRYDAAVVGAGPNGLAAAITLAKAGRSVVVLEAAGHAGGAVVTQELTLPGFRHDVFSSVYPAGAASPVFARMPLQRHGLVWVHPEVAMAHPLDDGRAGALYRDLDRTAAHLDAITPGDGTAWAQFARPYLRRYPALRATLLSGFPPIVGPLRLLAGLGLSQTLEFARLLLLPASVQTQEMFRGAHARAWLYGSVSHGDVAGTEAGSAITGTYLQLLGHAVGWPSPRGGAGSLTAALVGYLRELGGEIRTDATVKRVDSSGGRVTSVDVEGGDPVETGLVICDLTPHGLVRVAGDALPAGYRDKLLRFRYGPHTLKVDWALSAPVPWRAAEARAAGTVHVGGGVEDIMAATNAVYTGHLPPRPFLLFGQQSLADPTRAPAGKHTAWGYTRVPAGVDWSTVRDPHVERMETQIERFAPGFRDIILARHVLTPPAMQARNANLPGGDVGAGTYALDQLIFRPVPGLAPYRTPVRGLYIGSASTFPGGAVHGVPGRAAARFALAESRLRR